MYGNTGHRLVANLSLKLVESMTSILNKNARKLNK